MVMALYHFFGFNTKIAAIIPIIVLFGDDEAVRWGILFLGVAKFGL
jgi:hypothetical protein